MTREEAKTKLERQKGLIGQMMGSGSSPSFPQWRRDTEIAIENIFGKETRHLGDFTNISYTPSIWSSSNADAAFAQARRSGLSRADGILSSMIGEIDEYWPAEGSKSPFEVDHVTVIEKLCNRFHLVARQLRSRHGGRNTIEIEDEYDVQDLIHSLLKIHFDDVRAEEWTPSYAGGAARTDFLLKSEQIVIEVKKTRRSMTDRDLGDQLLIDIMRYQAHPDCERLICFVYDPEGRVGNPRGLENDLSKKHGDLEVLVIVAPQG